MKLYSWPNLLLLLVFGICVSYVLYCYPVAQLTWDSHFYLERANDMQTSIRPLGYPFVLRLLKGLSTSFTIIVAFQYVLYFCSILFFLNTIQRFFHLTAIWYFVLGLLLLIEPVAIYHCFNILSDVLFMCLTLGYVVTLIKLLFKKTTWLFIAHVFFIYASIEVRHIALFYPFLSIFILFVYSRHNLIKTTIYSIIICILYVVIYKFHVEANRKQYGVGVYSAFSGWTHANNALYALPRIKLDPKDIKDPEIRKMHRFVTSYFDSTHAYVQQVGSGYLWDANSPLCVMRQKIQDSLKIGFIDAWYVLAPLYGKYGMYLERHFPYEYAMGYMYPNIHTLITPHNGEMMDYYATPADQQNPYILEWYHKKVSDLHCRKQLYKDTINNWNDKFYHLRLVLFIIAAGVAAVFWRRIDKTSRKFLFVMGAFNVCFYLLTLYSSWFMQRYLLPAFPMQVSFIFITVMALVRKRKIDYGEPVAIQ